MGVHTWIPYIYIILGGFLLINTIIETCQFVVFDSVSINYYLSIIMIDDQALLKDWGPPKL